MEKENLICPICGESERFNTLNNDFYYCEKCQLAILISINETIQKIAKAIRRNEK